MRVGPSVILATALGCSGGLRLEGDPGGRDAGPAEAAAEAGIPDHGASEDAVRETTDVGVAETGAGEDGADAAPDLPVPACVPTGAEACDGVDNDCDGATDEDVCALAPCIGTIRSSIPGFEEATIGDALEAEGDGPVTVTLHVGGVGESLRIELTIPSDWAGGGVASATVRIYDSYHLPSWEPRETYTGSGSAGIDYLDHGFEGLVRGWFEILVGDGVLLHTVRGIFEASENWSGDADPCSLRRCLHGERRATEPCCCRGRGLSSVFSPRWCGIDESSTPIGDQWLQDCGEGCPSGYVCAPEPADAEVRLCRPACAGTSGCAAYEVCVDRACRPLRCDADDDCGDGRTCVAPAPGSSSPYCSARFPEPVSPDPCGPGMVRHERGFCARECSADRPGDCPTGWVCEHVRPGSPGGSLHGWCAPDCMWRPCYLLRADFVDALSAASVCSGDHECGWATCGDGGICCGLWEPYRAHCSGVVAINTARETPLLETLNSRWIFRCDISPNWSRGCGACDEVPDCSLRCASTAVGSRCVGDCP
ncbi:MAG: hypothetical protein QME96_11190 [Myxococcota bacterium]|nr:hypothetical protein [Myxococcota bacterium]